MAFFVLLTLVWLFAGLHLALGSEWMIITFIVLDAILVRDFCDEHVFRPTCN